MKKICLGTVFSLLFLSACNNLSTTENYVAGKIDDPYKILEAKREYYNQLEKSKLEKEKQLRLQKEKEEKAKKEKELKEQKMKEEALKKKQQMELEAVEAAVAAEALIQAQQIEENIRRQQEAEKARLAKIKAAEKAERERIKNLPPAEKLLYNSNKALKEIEAMDKIAKDARQEEIDNAKAIEEIQTTLTNIEAEGKNINDN